MGVTIIVVGLRIYARATIQAVGSDDGLILLALVSNPPLQSRHRVLWTHLSCGMTAIRYPIYGLYLHFYCSGMDISS